jgi:molybdopterin-guanine dinucleotide biosynthesis protein A
MPMKHTCTGVILAGGLSTRFDGKNKALFPVGEKPLLSYIYNVYKELFDEILLVTNEPLQYLDWDLEIVSDIYPIRSSMTGIHAGLFYAKHSYAFISGCDTPFIKKELVETILEGIDNKSELIIPETRLGLEPMCAVYSKNCLKNLERCLKDEKLKILKCLKKNPVKKISEKKVLQKDPGFISFFNINTPEDLDKAEALIRGETL